MTKSDRREFLRKMSALGAVGSTSAWLGNMALLQHASAQSTTSSDYRALVCVFLNGGNDAYNTVLATDPLAWRCYSTNRDPAVMSQSGTAAPVNMVSLALSQNSLLKITPKNTAGDNVGRTFGLNPQLKKIQGLFTQGKAAIVANVGPLIQPTTKAEYQLNLDTPVPQSLFSHNDQASTWLSFRPDGSTGGWGGAFMDKLASRNGNATFSSVGVNTNSVWLNGSTVAPYMLGTGGFQVMGGKTSQVYGSAAVYNAMRQAASRSSRTDELATDYLRVASRALSSEAALVQSLPAPDVAPWGTTGATSTTDPLLKYVDPISGASAVNPLAQQLQVVARMISARSSSPIGAKRQVFMVQLSGFDTHSAQMDVHASLMAKLDHGIGYFYNCLTGMPGGDISSQVTTFTTSEFGRALVNNGDGSDHGWGGHQFVFGGAVKGGDIYGHFPDFGAFDLNDATFFADQLIDGTGAMLPGIAVDQFAYTLGKWLGVSPTDLVGGMLPNINNFSATERDLGFMSV